ncbi:MAG: adenosylmethionine--8-amino-7-oxononanoate transaminase [Candidatus Omnitrophica bacterium]|nr:adenosylmethionine--8-amino-7-oxononanoate transaminase [Candidatus Omnitrophota bacterium]
MNNLIAKDRKYLWHPFTQMKDYKAYPPILIERAQGMKLFDTKGNFYYDTISSWWCNIHGHNHPKIKAAIKKQLDLVEHVLFAGFTHSPAIFLAQELLSVTPGNLSKVFFSDNGSTSVEVALKMSLQYWRNRGKKNKQKFVSLDYAYHGDTVGAMSVSGKSLFNEPFSPLLFDTHKVASPYCYRCPVGKNYPACKVECIKFLERVLQKKHAEICALILEPLVLAAGGMIIYPVEYLKKAAALCTQYNIHLILDEVATGFGRTGKMFACEHASITPDFMCLSKGISAGYLPLGATLTTEKIYNAFYADYTAKKTFYHGHTYTANPLACAAALASLNIFKEEETLKKIQPCITLLRKDLQRFRALNTVGNVRSLGLIGALELVKNKDTKDAFSFSQRIGMKVYKAGLKEHIVLRPLGNVIYFFLPLCIREKELKAILDKAFKIISKIS